ncbi:hypothetical protein OU415_02305 [Saccharopolyspora sp. WRP15-2]|uniref:Tail assembly chaperone n=1 Tax=Saccharopolyspora oryzae TaxID=2997343 RepID=A0ABT4UT02_9PSEU|nr:hypothetical protein [Saccharopolyspora oryzae]MDA3624249.1 hypothetical protein [Saccharopolyspora oryzae]
MPTARQKVDSQFDVAAFMESKAPKESINFFGVSVPVPTDTPLGVTLQARMAQQSEEEATQQNVLELLAGLLGQDIADQIEAANPGVKACGVLLLWAYRNAGGEKMGFPEAFEEYEANEAAAREAAAGEVEGKAAANRAERRAAARTTRNGKTSGGTSR